MNTELLARKIRSYSRNPFITTIFTADPSAHVWEDGRIYIYASRDMDPAKGCDLMDHYHAFSSDDLVNWQDEGEILCSEDVAWGRPEGGFMWAPDCACRNGKYYFYYPHPSGSDWNDTWKIGVAVSDKPAGRFKDLGYIESLGGFCMIDPCVFVDDDERIYMYYGGGGMCHGGEMNEDMVSMKNRMQSMAGLEDFHEAAWVFKRKDLYYLTYSDNIPGSNCLRYAISHSPLGPWDYKGIYLMPTGCDTSHGSVTEFKGVWYAFYHNQDISDRGNLRSICCDPLEFNEDGTIKMVVQSRSGLKPVSSLPTPNPRSLIYGASQCFPFGGARVITDEQAYENKVIRGLEGKSSYVEFHDIEGFDGQAVTLGLYYASADKLSKLRLTVNEIDYSLLNFEKTGSCETFTGYSYFTLKMNPGAVNRVRLSGDCKDIALEAISVEPI